MTKGEIAMIECYAGLRLHQTLQLVARCDDLPFDEQTALMLASPLGQRNRQNREVWGYCCFR